MNHPFMTIYDDVLRKNNLSSDHYAQNLRTLLMEELWNVEQQSSKKDKVIIPKKKTQKLKNLQIEAEQLAIQARMWDTYEARICEATKIGEIRAIIKILKSTLRSQKKKSIKSAETSSDEEEESPPHPTCWGCKEGQPNQQAHMDVGGCLFNPTDLEI